MNKYIGLMLISLFVSSCAFPAKYTSYIPNGNIVIDGSKEYPAALHTDTTFGRFGVAARNFDKLAIFLRYSPKPNINIKLDKNYIKIRKCSEHEDKVIGIPYLSSNSFYYIETQSVLVGEINRKSVSNNESNRNRSRFQVITAIQLRNEQIFSLPHK
ncbi:MAG: hypothetical protein ABW127_19370 [Candidatus Thiodiazotropha endolucinida]